MHPAGAAGDRLPGQRFFVVRRLPWFTGSDLFRQSEDKTTARKLRPVERQTRHGQTKAALEAALRNFQAMDGSPAHLRREPALSRDGQHIALHRDFEILGVNAGKRGDDPKLPLGLEDVEGRLPVGHLRGRVTGPKKLTMKPIGSIDHRAGFRPHPTPRIAFGHGNCLPCQYFQALPTHSTTGGSYPAAMHRIRSPRRADPCEHGPTRRIAGWKSFNQTFVNLVFRGSLILTIKQAAWLAAMPFRSRFGRA